MYGTTPVLRGLDEPVVVELVDVVFDHIDLLGDHVQQRLQRVALVGIAHAMDRGQQRVQAVGAGGVGVVFMTADSG
jgi:hypothetical protein